MVLLVPAKRYILHYHPVIVTSLFRLSNQPCQDAPCSVNAKRGWGQPRASAIRCQVFGRDPIEGPGLIRACIEKFRWLLVTFSDLCRRQYSCHARQHVGKSNQPAASRDQGEKSRTYWRPQSQSFCLFRSWKAAETSRSFSRCEFFVNI
jgi:hypothetical protein